MMPLSNYTRQNRVQTGDNHISCMLCGQSFTRKSSLTQHMLIHTGARPFCCATCGKSFARACTLKTHQLVHLKRNNPNWENTG